MTFKIKIVNHEYEVEEFVEPLKPSDVNQKATVRLHKPFSGYLINEAEFEEYQLKELNEAISNKKEFTITNINKLKVILSKDADNHFIVKEISRYY